MNIAPCPMCGQTDCQIGSVPHSVDLRAVYCGTPWCLIGPARSVQTEAVTAWNRLAQAVNVFEAALAWQRAIATVNGVHAAEQVLLAALKDAAE